jgi:hypothetical protein
MFILVFLIVGCNTRESIPDKTPPNVITRNLLVESNQHIINTDFNFQLDLYIEDLRNNIETVVINTMLQKPGEEVFNAVTDIMIRVNEQSFKNIIDLTILDMYFDTIGEYTFKIYIFTTDNYGNGVTFSTNDFVLFVNNQ